MSLTQAFFFHLLTTLWTLNLLATTDITHFANWRASFTFFYRSLRRVLRCRLWSSGMYRWWQIFTSSQQSKMKSFNGKMVLLALDKFESYYMKVEFRWEDCQFLEEFKNSVLSIVAARSNIGQGSSNLCPTILIGGDNYAPLQLFGLLLDGLLEEGWLKGSEVEVRRTEYQSVIQEQRQLEQLSIRSHLDVGNVLAPCSLQAKLRAWQHLLKLCIVTKDVEQCFNVYFE